jgi:hypothetical protein
MRGHLPIVFTSHTHAASRIGRISDHAQLRSVKKLCFQCLLVLILVEFAWTLRLLYFQGDTLESRMHSQRFAPSGTLLLFDEYASEFHLI